VPDQACAPPAAGEPRAEVWLKMDRIHAAACRDSPFPPRCKPGSAAPTAHRQMRPTQSRRSPRHRGLRGLGGSLRLSTASHHLPVHFSLGFRHGLVSTVADSQPDGSTQNAPPVGQQPTYFSNE
jgi:hypothetical protein